ncbi:MAG: hypothetical protein M3442_17690 [Chloroflexota bacterium]|nr:hypothetical protein [Chloroflexota bacterium]
MTARTPAEAVQHYVSPLQQVLSCFTRTVLDIRGGYHASPQPHTLTLGGSGDAVRLRGPEQLALSVVQYYRIISDPQDARAWRVSTAGYVYQLLEIVRPPRVIIGYHWHPVNTLDKPFPHVHLYSAAAPLSGRMHLPCGRIALEDVLRFAVYELEIEPLRPDWHEILNRTQAAFEATRTWGGSLGPPRSQAVASG